MSNVTLLPQLVKANHSPKRLNVVEQKIKATYSLTRREYDMFNRSILWLIGLMSEYRKDYKMVEAVSNFHEAQTLDSFSTLHSCEETLDEALTQWDSQAESWVEDFKQIFIDRFENLYAYNFKYDNYYSALEKIENNESQNFSWTKINETLPPLTTFNRSHGVKIVQRIKYGYTASDADKLHSFVAWHNARACLYYGFIDDAKGWLLFLKPEPLNRDEIIEAKKSVTNFVNIIDFMSF